VRPDDEALAGLPAPMRKAAASVVAPAAARSWAGAPSANDRRVSTSVHRGAKPKGKGKRKRKGRRGTRR
jgi:hypothetical protein